MIEDERGTVSDADAQANMVPAARREQIAALVAGAGPVSVRTLASRLQVSSDTVRRDLDRLTREGRLVRTHGGAMSRPTTPSNDGSTAFDLAFTPAKDAVGALAAGLVHDDTAIMVNAGATAVAMARHLRGRRGLTIVTNNLLIPLSVPAGCCRFMYVLGGEVRLTGQSTIGSVGQQLADSRLDIHCDLALVSIGGVTIERGYSMGDLHEAVMMHEMMARAGKVAILADSSKYGRQLFANVADLGEADYFVTDVTPPAELREALLAKGVEILTPSGVV